MIGTATLAGPLTITLSGGSPPPAIVTVVKAGRIKGSFSSVTVASSTAGDCASYSGRPLYAPDSVSVLLSTDLSPCGRGPAAWVIAMATIGGVAAAAAIGGFILWRVNKRREAARRAKFRPDDGGDDYSLL